MTVLTETRERFLLAIAAQVPAERIAEIHFFQPIRQGGVESGVAVVAAWPTRGAMEHAAAGGEVGEVSEVGEAGEVSEAGEAGQVLEVGGGDDSEMAVEHPEHPEQLERGELLPVSAPEPADAPEMRPTIYTARYRLTLKGLDRGKWETNVVAEADAPLVTLDAVVRGVQRRAGDVDEATRMDGDDVRAALETVNAVRAAAMRR